jgi:hypothetical protein
MRGILVGGLFVIALMAATGGTTQAAIRCNGAYQVNSLGEFRSPYCEDGYLASVARNFGMRVTGDQIRNSTSVKADVCRTIGFDSRIFDICSTYRGRNRGGHCKFPPCM